MGRTRISRVSVRFIAAGVVAALVLCAAASPAMANGNPVKIFLSYLEGVSNWGPTNGTGVAEVNLGEGEITVNVANLIQLEGEQYTSWLVNTSTDQRLPVGTFTVNERGYGFSHTFVEDGIDLRDQGFDLFVITAGSDPTRRVSIAGFFPSPEQPPQKPSRLPNTGGESEGTEATDVVLWLAPAAAAVILVAGQTRIMARRRGIPGAGRTSGDKTGRNDP